MSNVINTLASYYPDTQAILSEIARRRKRVRLSICDLFKQAGLNRSCYYYWQAGRVKPSIDAMSRLEGVLVRHEKEASDGNK